MWKLTCVSIRAQPNILLFCEERHPLDDDIPKCIPDTETIDAFIRKLVMALGFDDACLVIAIILLERTMRAASFAVGVSMWRIVTFISLVVASKVVFDENICLIDCLWLLPELSIDLKVAKEQEAVFLSMLDFRTVVRREQYARYYYAMQDVLVAYDRLMDRK
jgi:hypothetical protein